MKKEGSIEERIKKEEIDFINIRKIAPRFLIMSIYAYSELQQELGDKYRLFEDSDFESYEEITEYKGLEVSVSHSNSFSGFKLAI